MRCQNEYHYGTIGPVWHHGPNPGTAWAGRCGRTIPDYLEYCEECWEGMHANWPHIFPAVQPARDASEDEEREVWPDRYGWPDADHMEVDA